MKSFQSPRRSGRTAVGLSCVVLLLLLGACSEDGDNTNRLPAYVGGASGAAGIGGSGGAAGGLAVCVGGQMSCGGVCAAVQVDPRNCGQCNTNCNGGPCMNGQCACPTTLTVCPAGCIDTVNDRLNCGMCGRMCAATESCQQGQCVPPGAVCTPACTGGQTCTNNVCACPAPTTFCGGACVDTSTTPAHCSRCDAPCGAGQLCQAGQCACPAGQMLCDMQCVDVQLSAQHCGACGQACDAGEACMAGSCRAPAGADGCTGDPRDLQIQEVAVFQTVKVPLSRGTTVIDPTMRTAVIQNKPTLFRIYVAPGSGFTAREFSARVTVKNGTDEDQYFAKQRITKASTDADTASTFQVSVPRDRIQADTRYWVEVVECGTGGGTAGAAAPTAGSSGAGSGGRSGQTGGTGAPAPGGASGPRFPATGDTPLAAVNTGILKVRFIPLVANNRMPDMSDAVLDVYKKYLEAMYPVDEVAFSMAEPLEVAYPVSWNRVLDQLRAQRARDTATGAEEYYYGLLRPTQTFQEFCRGGCTAGISYIGNARQTATRVSLGLAYGDEMSSGIMAHEIGHAHGRPHAPCAPGGIQGVDSRYPHDGASTGVWTYDVRTMKVLDPRNAKDIMGYCEPTWISDYTYELLIDRSSEINEQMLQYTDPATVMAYRVVLLDAEGVSWGEPFSKADAPYGAPEQADVLDAGGQRVAQVTVYRTEIADNYGFSILVPPPQTGWHAIELRDAPPLPF